MWARSKLCMCRAPNSALALHEPPCDDPLAARNMLLYALSLCLHVIVLTLCPGPDSQFVSRRRCALRTCRCLCLHRVAMSPGVVGHLLQSGAGGDAATCRQCQSAVGARIRQCARSKPVRTAGGPSGRVPFAKTSNLACRAAVCATEAQAPSWPRSAALCTAMCGAAALACPSPAAASLGGALATSFREVAPDWAVVMTLASMPVVELRGAIPVGIVVLEQHPVLVFLLATVGNMLPVPIIMAGLGPFKRLLSNVRPLARLLDSMLGRARHQAEQFKEQHVFWALALFVGVPLPGTGAWSGAIVAYVLGLPFWAGVAANGIGVLIAGLIVTLLSCMGFAGFVLAVVVICMFPLASWMVRNLAQDPKSQSWGSE